MPCHGRSFEVSLPFEVWQLICDRLQPCDIVCAAVVCHDLQAAALDPALWHCKLSHLAKTATDSLAEPRGIETTPSTYDFVRKLSVAKGVRSKSEREAMPICQQFFHAVPHVATAAASALKLKAPELCFISYAWRAYDTTDFVSSHPGGSYHMQQHHGADATHIFDAFPHSSYAHDLMSKSMLRFDAIAYVGRYGAPAFACQTVPQSWSLAREAADSFSACVRDLSPTWKLLCTSTHAALAPRALVPSLLLLMLATCRAVTAREVA